MSTRTSHSTTMLRPMRHTDRKCEAPPVVGNLILLLEAMNAAALDQC